MHIGGPVHVIKLLDAAGPDDIPGYDRMQAPQAACSYIASGRLPASAAGRTPALLVKDPALAVAWVSGVRHGP